MNGRGGPQSLKLWRALALSWRKYGRAGRALGACRILNARVSVIMDIGRGEGAKRRRDVRLRVRTNNEVKVLIGQKHWSVRSRRQLRRRETGWRAAGSERPVHKQNNDELDSA